MLFRSDAFYEIGLNPWDVAAGWLLVTEAGGTVTSYRPFAPYKLGDFRILASNGHLHDPMPVGVRVPPSAPIYSPGRSNKDRNHLETLTKPD